MARFEDINHQFNSPQLIPTYKQQERKLLSIFLSLLELSPEIRGSILAMCGYNSGRTATYKSLMEVSFQGSKYPEVRPDGLISCVRGKSDWSAFIEAKADKAQIRSEQIQDYAALAGLANVGTIVTISNEFAREPSELPYHIPPKIRKSVPIYHFAWADIRTHLELLKDSAALSETERAVTQQCLEYFWWDGSGILTYDQMPQHWPDFVEAASTALGFNQNIKGLSEIVYGWQQERRDLCSKLTHMTGEAVELRHLAGRRSSEEERLKRDKSDLADSYTLNATYVFKTTKGCLDIQADLRACRTTASFDVPLPEDKGAKGLTTWLLSRLQEEVSPDAVVCFDWPGRQNDLVIPLGTMRQDPEQCFDGRKSPPKSVKVMLSAHGVRRFKSRKRFVEDLEALAIELVGIATAAKWV